MKINIIKLRKFFLTFSGTLTIISILLWIMWGLNLGIDFTGGTTMELNYSGNAPTAQEIQTKLKDLNLGQLDIRFSGANDVVLRFKEISETVHQSILDQLGRPASPSLGGPASTSLGGCSSVVECLLAKEEIGGSSPLTRSSKGCQESQTRGKLCCG